MEREWRCKKCYTSLDVERGARLHVRYKQATNVRYRPEDLDVWIAEEQAQCAALPEVA
jgi:hypothetical protein